MSALDRKRVAAVELLESLGYCFNNGDWTPPASPSLDQNLTHAADQMHGILMDRAGSLAGCIEDSDDEDELTAIGEALEAYEAQRWPDGRIPDSKLTAKLVGPI